MQKSTQVHRYLDHNSEDEVDAVASELLYEAAQRRSHVSFSAAAFQAFAVEAVVPVLVNHVIIIVQSHLFVWGGGESMYVMGIMLLCKSVVSMEKRQILAPCYLETR